MKPACLCLRQPTTEIKADIGFITKTMKQKIMLLFCCCAYFFLQNISILSRKEKNRKLINTLK